MTKTIILIAAALSAAAPVAATASTKVPSTTVSASGLALDTTTGRAELDRRIERAAAQVCHDQAMHNPNLIKDMRACRHIAIANATAQRDALYASAKLPGRVVLASR